MSHLFINGEAVAGQGARFSSVCPYNNQVVWRGASASQEQVQQAVSAAQAASQTWRLTPVAERQHILQAYAQLLKQERGALALLITQETGKPLWETQQEVDAMVNKVALSVQAYQERTGELHWQAAGNDHRVRHKPHGVLAVYGPYNFPGHLPNGHIVPALLAGNSIVFKPSEQTPAVAQRMVELLHRAGLPAGVINLLQGAADVGIALAADERLKGICFTGSAKTGIALHRQMAGQVGKMLALELGGNNPLVVGDCADIEAVVFNIVQSAFITSGQRCSCARRLILPAGTKGDALLAELIKVTQRLKMGDPSAAEQPYLGTMISSRVAQQLLQVQNHLQHLGAEVHLAMGQANPELGYLTPGIVEVSPQLSLPDEEYFGPLLQLYRYQHFDQAIDLANQTDYGLSAGLLADDPQQYQQFLQQINAGIVNWNKPTTGASSRGPFGGIGNSGNHRASGYYAADYCAYPVASTEQAQLAVPTTLPPGLTT